MPTSRSRAILLGTLLWIAGLSLIWAAVIAIAGGFDTTLAGIRIRSNSPSKVLLVAVVALALFRLAGGRFVALARDLATRSRRAAAAVVANPEWIAIVLAIGTMTVAMARSTRTAGGPDAYGYVSQADLWLEGRLKLPQPWIAEMPWREPATAFSPLGYRPAPHGEAAIVPTYSPGLPMMFAVAKSVAGQCGLFALVPMLTGIGVFAAYRLGRKCSSPWTALAGAWLLATSPAVLGVSVEPISDIPAMTIWTLAFLFLLGRRTWSLLLAGLFVSIAILVRPNLAVLAGPMALWPLVRREDTPTAFTQRIGQSSIFVAGALPGVLIVAALNQYLYGAPWLSGYGKADEIFSVVHVVPNLRRYLSWLIESQTVLGLLGIAAIAWPGRRIWPDVRDRSIFIVIGLFVLALWALYLGYLEFDSWGFLRFLLPSWPFLTLATAAPLVAVARVFRRTAVSALVAIVIVGVGFRQVAFAKAQGVFDERQAARHEIVIGPLVSSLTEPTSVVITIQRSGSVRYYAGRMTIRYDQMRGDTIDRDVQWLIDHGVPVYALFDDHEVEEFGQMFAGHVVVQALDRPLLIYRPGGLRLFDMNRASPFRAPVVINRPLPDSFDCVPPQPRPELVVRR